MRLVALKQGTFCYCCCQSRVWLCPVLAHRVILGPLVLLGPPALWGCRWVSASDLFPVDAASIVSYALAPLWIDIQIRCSEYWWWVWVVVMLIAVWTLSGSVSQGPRGLRGLQGPMGPVGDRVSSSIHPTHLALCHTPALWHDKQHLTHQTALGAVWEFRLLFSAALSLFISLSDPLFRVYLVSVASLALQVLLERQWVSLCLLNICVISVTHPCSDLQDTVSLCLYIRGHWSHQ